jgi:putative ABC transport system substrate-binding protein
LAVHCGNGFDAQFEPYQRARLSRYNAALSLGADMRRREFINLLGGAAAWPLAARAQQPAMPVVGFLGALFASSWASRVEALRAGLRDLGYVEGKNIVVEFRWAEGNYNRLPELAHELVRLKVDVLVTHGTPGTRAAQQATKTIPIVMAISGDAVATDLVASLNRPGGNTTGSTFFSPELNAKQLELLKEAVPSINQVGVLVNPDNPLMNRSSLQALETTASSLKVVIQLFEARGRDDFESAFLAMANKRVDAVAITEDAVFIPNPRVLADLASRNRLPSTGSTEFAQAGGLIGYGVHRLELFRRAAYFVDKILKGTKPADLPVEQPTKFEVVANLKAARALGLEMPTSILLRADEVIE